MELPDDVAHQVHAVGTARTVVADRARHAVVERLVDDGDGQHTVLPLVDVRVVEHDAVAVKSVHDDVVVVRFIVVADDRHRVAVLLDAVVQEFELGRRNGIGIVCVWFDLLYRDRDHLVYRTLICHIKPPDCQCPVWGIG